ncbi:hypothetical protein [Natronomonas sp. EA1]|uniref:hypothetical protein n=1 Tax=Natronomonas sp. EA1 TaxID=3421655 RepID=UPI003EBBE442
MSIVSSLPNRGLTHSELDALREVDRVDAVHPVFGREDGKVAYGFVLVAGRSVRGVAYAARSGTWSVVAETTFEAADAEGEAVVTDVQEKVVRRVEQG